MLKVLGALFSCLVFAFPAQTLAANGLYSEKPVFAPAPAEQALSLRAIYVGPAAPGERARQYRLVHESPQGQGWGLGKTLMLIGVALVVYDSSVATSGIVFAVFGAVFRTFFEENTLVDFAAREHAQRLIANHLVDRGTLQRGEPRILTPTPLSCDYQGRAFELWIYTYANEPLPLRFMLLDKKRNAPRFWSIGLAGDTTDANLAVRLLRYRIHLRSA